MRQIDGQLDIFQFLDVQDPTKPIPMPEWDEYKEMVQNCKGLDEVMDKLPKYLVTFKKPVWRLPYPIKKEICVYVGEWHSISGWSWSKPDELLNIESWEPIEYKKAISIPGTTRTFHIGSNVRQTVMLNIVHLSVLNAEGQFLTGWNASF